MSTVFQREIDGPAMHVLLIGVGAYPHCGPGRGRDKGTSVAAELHPLTTSEPSVAELADWLLRTQMHDPVLPLGSLEVAVSPIGEDPAVIGDVEVERADYAGVDRAFKNWFHRGDERADAVVVFYFVGHGCSLKSGQQALLLEDFGADEFNEFAGALDFVGTYDGMHRCKAQSQLFFIDCCREVPIAMAEQPRLDARALVQANTMTTSRTTALTIYATSRGRPAYGRRNGATPFSVALRHAFDGLAAEQGGDSVWRVQADQLGTAVRRVIGFPSGVSDEMLPTCEYEVMVGLALRQLAEAPDVPFEVKCAPFEATAEAHFELAHSEGGAVGSRPPSPGSWIGQAKPGVYQIRTDFRGGPWRNAAFPGWWCIPPLARRTVEVTRL